MTGRHWIVAPLVFAAAVGFAASAPPDVRIGDVRVVEGDSGDRSVDVTITLSQPATGPVTVSYTTRDGTALAGSDYRAASGTVTFARGEATKKIAVRVIGDVATEADETVDVVLGPATGAAIVDNTATVTIINDDLPVSRMSVYEVRLSYVGSTGSLAGTQDCPVRSNGRATLTGLISGFDAGGAGDDIQYTGVLHYEVDIDFCEVDSISNNADPKLCAITVVGAGPMKVDLVVHEGDRGGYIKAKKAPGNWMANAFGSCPATMVSHERTTFPDNSMASLFDGTDLPLRSGALQVGQYQDGSLLVEVLRVVRRGR